MAISVESSLEDKIEHAKQLIRENINKFNGKSAVACSFGKDSVVLVHLARQVKKDVSIFITDNINPSMLVCNILPSNYNEKKIDHSSKIYKPSRDHY